MQILHGKEHSIFNIGGKLVKVARAERNGEVFLAVADDDSAESLREVREYRHRDHEPRRSRCLEMCVVPAPSLQAAVA